MEQLFQEVDCEAGGAGDRETSQSTTSFALTLTLFGKRGMKAQQRLLILRDQGRASEALLQLEA